MRVLPLSSLSPDQRRNWDVFAQTQPGGIEYHRTAWIEIFGSVYGYRDCSLAAIDRDGRIRGLLPLTMGKRLSGAREIVSLPHHAYAGLLADSAEARDLLVREAIKACDETGARSLQIRSFERLPEPRLRVQDHKVHFMVDLSRGLNQVWRSLKNTLRHDIKHGYLNGIRTCSGGSEYLPLFFQIYQRLERELGLPAHPLPFFEKVCDLLGPRARFFVNYIGGRPIGAILAVIHPDRLELVWGGTPHPHKFLHSTAILFWRAGCWGHEQGLRSLDFGRSTRGSSVYAFKKKWRAPECPLFYHFYMPGEHPLPDPNPATGLRGVAVSAWKRLPLSVTERLGGFLMRYLF